MTIIFDRKDEFLAVGLYDPESPIRVRILHAGKVAQINDAWWQSRLAEACKLRAHIFDAETNGGRWINGESDRFPGLVLDRYADTLVLKLYSAIWFPRLEEMVELFKREFKPERIVLRLSRNIQAAARKTALTDPSLLFGSNPEGAVVFLESGLRFEADVMKGQKTGFFLDQRENRRRVGALCQGKDVLNAFSFSGGFSVYAARGGARRVTDVDISAHALESARRNFALNEAVTRNCTRESVHADVFEWLQQPPPTKFDVIILDPPSLAKRQADRPASLKAYANLAEAGVRLAREKAVLICCSCSAHIRAEEFFETVSSSASQVGRKIRVLAQTREPVDHHAAFPEAEYLKAIYLEVGA